MVSQLMIEHYSLLSHTSSGWKNKGEKDACSTSLTRSLGTLQLPPETPNMDVSPSFILMVSSLWLKKLPSKRLQRWFSGDIMTNPRKQLSSDVSQSIVATNVRPPCLHIITWSAENETPQTQWLGIFGSFQPYLRCKAFQNSCFIKWNPCSPKGRAVSQEEAPSSLFKSNEMEK